MALLKRTLTGLSLVLFLGLTCSIWAQASARPKEAPAFTVYAHGQSDLFNQLFYLPRPDTGIKLAFSGGQRSEVIRPASTTLALAFGVERIDPETQKKTYVKLAEAKWPAGAIKVLLIFEPAVVAGAPSVKITPMDDGLEAFPLGTVRFFNPIAAQLMARVDKAKLDIPSGVTPACAYPVSADPTLMNVFKVSIGHKNDQTGAVKLVLEQHFDAWPSGRILLFLAPPRSENAGVAVDAIIDTPEPPSSKY